MKLLAPKDGCVDEDLYLNCMSAEVQRRQAAREPVVSPLLQVSLDAALEIFPTVWGCKGYNIDRTRLHDDWYCISVS